MIRLQTGAVDDLDVDGELTASIIEDKDADGATAGLEGVVEAGPEVGLVNDGQALLDVAGLGHGSDVTIGEVEDAVLLEDGAEHGLDNDAGGGVGDEGGLLVELLGEEVDTEVAVLAGGGGGGDLDDLAGAALEHQEVAEADVVAGDGNGVGEERGTGARAGRLAAGGGSGANLGDFVTVSMTMMMMVVMMGVSNLVRQLVKALTERMVVAWWCEHPSVSVHRLGGRTAQPKHTHTHKAQQALDRQASKHTHAQKGVKQSTGEGDFQDLPSSS